MIRDCNNLRCSITFDWRHLNALGFHWYFLNKHTVLLFWLAFIVFCRHVQPLEIYAAYIYCISLLHTTSWLLLLTIHVRVIPILTLPQNL